MGKGANGYVYRATKEDQAYAVKVFKTSNPRFVAEEVKF